MGKVVAYVSKYSTTKHCSSYVPVPVKDGMGKLVERSCKCDE